MSYGLDITTRLVVGQFLSPSGSPAKGTVTIIPSATVTGPDGQMVIAGTNIIPLDSSGQFSIELPCTDDPSLSPVGWYYTVRTRTSGVPTTEKRLYLPMSESGDPLVLSETAPPIRSASTPMQASSPASPALFSLPLVASYAPDTVVRNVFGQYLNSDGGPSTGTITFMPSSKILDDQDNVIISNPVIVTLDDNGEFSIDLPCTDNYNLKPLNWYYRVRTRTSGAAPSEFRIYFPYEDGEPVNITTLDQWTDTPVGLAAVTSNRGPVGPTGNTGAQGLTGTQGLQGTQGTQGTQGVQGLTGLQGIQGTQGLQGVGGQVGTQGTTGSQGVQGLQGLQGVQGLQGLQGILGDQGIFIGASPPANTSILWADTSSPGTAMTYVLVLSQAEYDSIAVKDPFTLYVVV